MISLLTHLIPIGLGFFAKLTAIKSKQSHDEHKLMLQAMGSKRKFIDNARDQSNKESSMAAWNRRFLIVIILALVAIYPLAGIFGIEIIIEFYFGGQLAKSN